ncbi:MAG: AI-2E family transporter [Elusimicrobia bacterium]|nr:AI-2E family transporter [Elusimicrobiota bacterium]
MRDPRALSHILFATVLLATIPLHLGPLLLAGLFSFMILHFAFTLFNLKLRKFYAKWLAVFCFVVVTLGVSWMLAHFVRQTVATFPKIAITVMPKAIETAERFGVQLPFDNVNELRAVAVEAVKENAMAITRMSKILTRQFFHIVVGVFLAILYFMAEQSKDYKPNLFDSVRKEFNARIDDFLSSCDRVIGAQVTIAAINTVLTAIFLIATDIPYIGFLIPATFILGALPIIGNILSNTLIIATALTISLKLSVLALAFLVVIHKLEYFLNSRIVGSAIDTPMWQTLLGILIGEAVMGVPGIILAPAVWHYIRKELRGVAPEGSAPRPQAAGAPERGQSPSGG